MNINSYHKQQIIGWLFYNQHRIDNSDNRVCYIYPRYLFSGGRYNQINNQQDFPTQGRIAVRVLAPDNTDIHERFGSIVSVRINTVPTPNYNANNYYMLRYNPQYGRDGSEIWIERIDGNAFYQLLTVNHTIHSVLQHPENESGLTATELYSNNVLLSCNDGRVYGPFEYSRVDGKIKLQGLPRFDYIIGAFDLYGSHGLSTEVLTFLDQSEQPCIEMLPTLKMPDPRTSDNVFDTISQQRLLEIFLDNAKSQLRFSRNEFRSLRAYSEQLFQNNEALDLTPERFQRLSTFLPRLFDDEKHYRQLLEITLNNDELRKHIIADIANTQGNDLARLLPSSQVNEIRYAVQNKVAESLKAQITAEMAAQAKKAEQSKAPALEDKRFNFLLSPDIKKNIEAIIEESSQMLSRLNVLYSNSAFLSDEDSDIDCLQSKKEMSPENIKHTLDVSTMLLGFIGNLHLIIDGALKADEDIEHKRFREYNNLSTELDKLYQEISKKCSHLRGSTELQGFIKNYQPRTALGRQLPPSANVNSKNNKNKGKDKNNQKVSEEAVAAADAAALDKIQQTLEHMPAGTEKQIIATLQKQLRELKQECENYQRNEQLQINVQNLQAQLEKLQSNLESKENELKDIQGKINDQGKLSNEIISKLQKSMAQYKDQANTAVQLLDASILNTILGQGNELGSYHHASLSSSEAEAAASIAASASSANSAATVSANVLSSATSTAEGKSEISANLAAVNASAPVLSGTAPATAVAAAGSFDMQRLAPASEVDSAEKLTSRVMEYLNVVGNRNLSFNEVANYLICISQGFITTIAGEPGTGKTSLCNLLAHALGLASKPNPRFIEVSVERGWTSLKDLIGYYNPLTKRMEKSNAEVFDAFSLLNVEAHQSPDGGEYDPSKIAPYLVLLDEANLSPIEHYWAAFFRNCDMTLKMDRSISLGGNAIWSLPDHLRFLATVNFDHTTEELSSRFLDRSWVITLNPSSIQLDDDEDNIREQEPSMVSFDSLQQAFNRFGDTKLNNALKEKWQRIQDIFASEQCSLPIRPRNSLMVHRYCLAAQQCMQCNSDSTMYAPLDYAVAQKILPTINGSGERYKHLVEELLKECNEQTMPLCAYHLKRIKRNGGADLGFYQFFAR